MTPPSIIQPFRMKWACQKCGRIFEPEQVGDSQEPSCFFCGPDARLKKWRENPNWTFIFWGAIGLPFVGHLVVLLALKVGFSSQPAKLVSFFLFPAILALINLPAVFVGSSTGNRMMKRGGVQGILTLLGFGVAVALLLATGHFARLLEE